MKLYKNRLGVIMRKTSDYQKEIKGLLASIGYTFSPFERPLPPVLQNADVARELVIKFYLNVYNSVFVLLRAGYSPSNAIGTDFKLDYFGYFKRNGVRLYPCFFYDDTMLVHTCIIPVTGLTYMIGSYFDDYSHRNICVYVGKMR